MIDETLCPKMIDDEESSSYLPSESQNPASSDKEVLMSGKGDKHSCLHHSLQSIQGDSYIGADHSKTCRIEDESDSSSTLGASHSDSPPLSLHQNMLAASDDYNFLSNSQSMPTNRQFGSNRSSANITNKSPNFPKKTWERHYRSFLSKLSNLSSDRSDRQANSLNLPKQNSIRTQSPSSTTLDNSTGSGKVFRNIFKNIKDRQKSQSRSGIRSVNNSPSTTSQNSGLSMDTSLRRGKEKGSHKNASPHIDIPQQNIASSSSTQQTNAISNSNIPQYFIAPNVTGNSLLLPPLSNTSSPSTLDIPLRGGINRYRSDDEKYWDKDKRKFFTEFHSSNEFGNDSTSAFLGENSSCRQNSLFLSMYNSSDLKKYSVCQPMSDIFRHQSLPNQLYSSQPLLPVSESVTSNLAIVLNPIEGAERWDPTGMDINDDQLIAPAIIANCPIQVLSVLISEENINSSHGFGSVVLGSASVAQFGPRAHLAKDKYGWTKALFVLRQNFLLEYSCDVNYGEGKPRGYAHLEDSTVTAHNEFPNVLELIVRDDTMGNNKKKMLLIKVDSLEEREQWVDRLKKAANLNIDDLYVFNDCIEPSEPVERKELGKGRYSNIFAARRKSTTDMEIEKGITGQLFSSDNSSNFNRAVKIISKSVFWDRVRGRYERVDTLVRETSVQATLTEHASRMTQCTPFLQLQGFFETRKYVVLELELLEGKDLFQYIVAKGSLEEHETACIMRDILDCLTLTERLGIAHRDIKPANILMCNKNNDNIHVKVGDYGMATYVGVDGLVRGRCGTPGYVAPEIFNSGANAGYKNKVDVFSAGVTLYVLLCGYEPFYGETDDELKIANKAAKVEFLESDWEHISCEAKDLVQKMMEVDPTERISAENALQHPWIVRSTSSFPRLGEKKQHNLESAYACTVS